MFTDDKAVAIIEADTGWIDTSDWYEKRHGYNRYKRVVKYAPNQLLIHIEDDINRICQWNKQQGTSYKLISADEYEFKTTIDSGG